MKITKKGHLWEFKINRSWSIWIPPEKMREKKTILNEWTYKKKHTNWVVQIGLVLGATNQFWGNNDPIDDCSIKLD